MRYRSYQSFRLTTVLTLIIINIIIFIGYLINSSLFLDLFGLQRISFFHQPWTIVTSLFVHAGVSHILFNMLTLYWFGTALSSLVGEKKFLIVYFGGGLLGNILFLLLALPYSIAVGASGAIFALGGVLAAMRPRLKVYIIPIPVPIPLWISVIGSFVVLSFVPGIARQAHLGGLVLGLISGYFFRRQESRHNWR